MSDNQYLNIIVHNPINGSVEFPDNLTAVYDETLTIPVLSNPDKYYCSIIRFGIPIDLVPIFVFPVNPQQNNANVSNLIIGVSTGGVQYSQPLTYHPANNLPAPTAGSSAPYFQDFQRQSPYYFVYSIQDMIDMINTSLLAAFTAAGSPGGTAPYYIYTPNGQVISLIVTSTFTGSNPTATIFMNSALNVYLNSFRYTTNNDINGPYMFTHNLVTIPYGQSTPYKFDWEYNAIDLWLDARKIVVTSQSLPTRQEASPTLSIGTNGTALYQPIITDYLLSFNNIQDLSSIVVYAPSAQYRLIDLFKTEPLSRLNFQFYWQSEAGALFPILLSPGQSITVKIAFFNKSLYLNY